GRKVIARRRFKGRKSVSA
ncbi:MAG: 50S ribosomal protein L34, partial [Candidatus Fonsibacter lacus]